MVASLQKPQVVMRWAISRAYSHEYSKMFTAGCTIFLTCKPTQYEAVRGDVAAFLNAGNEDHSSFKLRHHHSKGSSWSPMVGPCRTCPAAAIEIILSVMEGTRHIRSVAFSARTLKA